MGLNRTNEEAADLDELIGQALIDDVLGVVKSGKEATVYCCRAGDRLVAAKVYRSEMVRQFANASAYNAGRIREKQRREARAIEHRSKAGREMAFGRWVAAEYETLELLHAAGCEVPEPLHRAERIILMEFFGDEEGAAEPLHQVRYAPDAAQRVFARIMANIETMLRCDRVHGDLSPYNVLALGEDIRIIDFPQAVDARFNPNARALLERDIERIAEHFSRMGVRCDAWRTTNELWGRYIRADL